MRFWKPQLALGLAAAAVLALAVTLFVRRGVVDVLLVILIGAALVGMYFLHRYARTELLYLRRADRRRATQPKPESTRDEAPTDRGGRSGSGPSAVTPPGQPIVRS